MPIRRALISVSDKRGIVELAQQLVDCGVEILSTGGTARVLADAGVCVREVAEYTGLPELMNGRVKTLHPRIHGGLLGRRDEDAADMQAHHIEGIDLLVVNLYPFERVAAEPDCSLERAIEHIDIGGPAMVRSAAKNHAWVTVIVDPDDYAALLEDMRSHAGATSPETRYRLALKAFEQTARYDAAISAYLARRHTGPLHPPFPQRLALELQKKQDLRYGENPHQRGAFYTHDRVFPGTVAAARQIQGKALSYNNIADVDAALECAFAFDDPVCVIVKHANPCGIALGVDLTEAYRRAYACDVTSAYGGIVAFNRVLDAGAAAAVLAQFVEVVAAPGISDEARAVCARKPDLRVLETGYRSSGSITELDVRSVAGGLLIQDRDSASSPLQLDDQRVVTRRRPDAGELRDLMFAWRVAHFVKSNAIVYARAGQTIGIGAGQMSRVYSARIAAIKANDAGLPLTDAVMASDAFLPFRDGIDTAAAGGIRAVIQPGGSIRDREIIDAADEHGIAMVFTGVRHFRH